MEYVGMECVGTGRLREPALSEAEGSSQAQRGNPSRTIQCSDTRLRLSDERSEEPVVKYSPNVL
jgi:hypothetical protein